MTEYTVLAKFRNRKKALFLISQLEKRSKSCYNFFELPDNDGLPSGCPEKYMQATEGTNDFYNDPYFKKIFKKDLEGLQNAEKVIVLLPAGNSVHIEAGIAYGLGKQLILIGKISKPESLYLIFAERHKTITDFLKTIPIK